MRRIHRESLTVFFTQLRDVGGSAALRKGKYDMAEGLLEKISRQPTSDLIQTMIDPTRLQEATKGMPDVFAFVLRRVRAELDLRIPTPAADPD